MTLSVCKRILFRVDGSWEIGLGHVFRMRALAVAMRDAGYTVAVLTLDDPVSLRLFEEASLKCFAFKKEGLLAARDHAIAEFLPDLVVFDILQLEAQDLLPLREVTPARVVAFDDVGAGLQLADAVINAIVFHWERYEACDARATLYEGPEYMVLQDDVYRFIALEPRICETASRVLVAVGGTDTRGMTVRAVQALSQVEVPLDIRVNFGPGGRHTPDLVQVCEDSPHPVTLLHAVPSLSDEFWQSDLVICGGGTMLYELAAMGIPAAAIATEPHEARNIAYWERQGTVIALGSENNFEPSAVGARITTLLANTERRRAMSSAGRATVDGDGLRRIQAILSEMLAC